MMRDTYAGISAYSKHRFAVLVMFFINGALFASWVSRIPFIQNQHELGEGSLGVVLLGVAAGVLTALSVAGWLIARYGSRVVTAVGAFCMCALLPLLSIMPNAPFLWIGLFLFGMAMSTMDVAMNAQAVGAEKRIGRPLMSSFHAAFSIGGICGAGIGALAAKLSIDPPFQFLFVSGLFLLLIVFFTRSLIPKQPAEAIDCSESSTTLRSSDGDSPIPIFSLPHRGTWAIGVVALMSAFGEGAMADWSAVYLSNIVGTGEDVAALGFAVFSGCMTIGRLFGDRLSKRYSSVTVVKGSALVAGGGLLIAVLFPQLAMVLLGFSLVGLGLSVVMPTAFSAAGHLPGISTGAGIAGVATIGYAGFLAGPPFVGLIAEAVSLRLSLLLAAVLILSLFISSTSLKQHR